MPPDRDFGDRIIYTTLFGHGDTLKQPARPQPGWRLVCVTNRHDLAFGAWTPLFIDKLHHDPRRTARVFKILPWLVFPEAKLSLFVDASIRITGSVEEFLERYCAGAELSCFVHPSRRCTYGEAMECIKQGKDEVGIVTAQMDGYRGRGFPADAGLIASGVIARRQTAEDVRALMWRWVDEVERHSARDQLSFNFSSWVTGTPYNPVPLDIFDNPFFEVLPHARLQRFDGDGRDVSSLSEKAGNWMMKAKSAARRRYRRLLKLFPKTRRLG